MNFSNLVARLHQTCNLQVARFLKTLRKNLLGKPGWRRNQGWGVRNVWLYFNDNSLNHWDSWSLAGKKSDLGPQRSVGLRRFQKSEVGGCSIGKSFRFVRACVRAVSKENHWEIIGKS